jgi:hypothetical protein
MLNAEIGSTHQRRNWFVGNDKFWLQSQTSNADALALP